MATAIWAAFGFMAMMTSLPAQASTWSADEASVPAILATLAQGCG